MLQGGADRTVNPANANEIFKQWLDVHQLRSAPMSEGTVDGYPRQVWWDADGETIIESYTITDMAHGTPLGVADNDERYGAQGEFLIEAGISSSYHIASFFGLTGLIRRPRSASSEARQPAKNTPATSAPPTRLPDVVPALRPLTAAVRHAAPARQPHSRGLDVGGVITRALTAAGLMK